MQVPCRNIEKRVEIVVLSDAILRKRRESRVFWILPRGRGDILAKRELDSILDAEAKASLAMENAKAKAKEMFMAAEREAEAIMRDWEEKARLDAETDSVQAQKEREAYVAQARARAQAEIQNLRLLSDIWLDKAVDMIVKRTKEAM